MNSFSPTTPARPRDAASLLIYERNGDNVSVLMGKRAKGHRFLPDVYVFPGGRVDPEDLTTGCLSPLRTPVSNQLSTPGDMAHGLGVAAVRETFEETGLVIGKCEDNILQPDLSNLDYIVRAITPAGNPIRFNTRFLTVDAAHITGDLGGSGELIDLRWFPLDEALAMPLVDVTEFVLEELVSILSNKVSLSDPVQLYTYRNGVPSVRREK
ncbi:NUDIX hydrolase [Sneathiella chinensis]|uniref:Hydrolase n=1 Tax=Sneathiella chinensis TaxID=349750 RepID=A0ABQ5U6A8_9PROT|nr:NUDIX domain-containing protein [Sneathiella chinensis]GLQ07669.1 hydrolase [Sneathiella chinensis]